MRRTGKLFCITLVYVVVFVSLSSLCVVPVRASELRSHDPILIVGNSGFTFANGVTGGTGTSTDPYLIEGWHIDSVSANNIEIRNTTAHFVVRSVLLSPTAPCCQGVVFGVLLIGVANGQIVNSTIVGGPAFGSVAVYGIRAIDSANLLILGNSISKGLYGIDIVGSSSITVQDNSLVQNGYGLIFSHSKLISVVGNNISDNSNSAIEPVLSNRIVISNNTLRNNTEQTIGAYNSSSVLVSNNLIEYSHYGGHALGFFGGKEWTVVGNLINENSQGISVGYTKNVTISNNYISENFFGFTLYLVSNDVSIHHNNIINNTYQVNVSPSPHLSERTVWDDGYPSGGNFWSDYIGADSCSGPDQSICKGPDGLGDVPRTIDAASQDNYPLMRPFAGSVFGEVSFRQNGILSKSNGKYATIHIKLPPELSVSAIVPSSILVNGTVTLADGAPVIVGIRGPDVTPVLIVKFTLAELKTLLPKPGNYRLTITGNIVTDTSFRQFTAFTTIRMR